MTDRFVDKTFTVSSAFDEKPWLNWWPQLGWKKLLHAHAGFKLDWDAISNYCDFIELRKLPIIKLKESCDIDLGVTMYPQGRAAYVHMNEKIIPQAASVCLAHEIYHCKQHEERGHRFPDTVPHVNPTIIGWDSYWNHPTERGAREYEEYGIHTMLVKEL